MKAASRRNCCILLFLFFFVYLFLFHSPEVKEEEKETSENDNESGGFETLIGDKKGPKKIEEKLREFCFVREDWINYVRDMKDKNVLFFWIT
jgi:hypothetical protein